MVKYMQWYAAGAVAFRPLAGANDSNLASAPFFTFLSPGYFSFRVPSAVTQRAKNGLPPAKHIAGGNPLAVRIAARGGYLRSFSAQSYV